MFVCVCICVFLCVCGESWGFVDKLTVCMFSSGLVGSRVCVLRGIFVFLGVQISPLRDQCLT